mmetsp:Transcript_107826/g.185879  ORF Transcript_107826/g.185879 Transcript_107826/m.185879 type:complete len:204 (+) Transcript_107826:1576-2187(+)
MGRRLSPRIAAADTAGPVLCHLGTAHAAGSSRPPHPVVKRRVGTVRRDVHGGSVSHSGKGLLHGGLHAPGITVGRPLEQGTPVQRKMDVVRRDGPLPLHPTDTGAQAVVHTRGGDAAAHAGHVQPPWGSAAQVWGSDTRGEGLLHPGHVVRAGYAGLREGGADLRHIHHGPGDGGVCRHVYQLRDHPGLEEGGGAHRHASQYA